MTISIAGGRERSHRIDPVARGRQSTDEESSVGFDAHQNLNWVIHEGFHELVEPPYSFDSWTLDERHPRTVQDTDIVVSFRPVHADEDRHRASSRCREPEEAVGRLMEVLEVRHPTSRVGVLTDQKWHDLEIGLEVLTGEVLTC
jgi:hypothetical protein